MPLAFVGIWATGFIVARLVAPHADPLTFLSIRFVLGAALFAGVAGATGAAWPRGRGWRDAAVVGVLMQGVYLAGVFWSVRHGLAAGVAALVAGLQPLLTAALAGPVLGERVGARRWAGIGMGLAGAVLVLWPSLRVAGVSAWPLLAAVAGMVGMTAGTLWQKRTGAAGDLRAAAAVQFAAALVVVGPLALATEGLRFDGAWEAWAGLAWAVGGLSFGAISLLLLLIRRGAVAGVASLFYLVPPVVAVLAWALFGETLTVTQGVGMALAAAGVAVAR